MPSSKPQINSVSAVNRQPARAKLIEYLRAESLATVARILGPRFVLLVNEIELGRATGIAH
jgi:hypothetical protein